MNPYEEQADLPPEPPPPPRPWSERFPTMFAIVAMIRSFFTAYAKKWEADFWETLAITVAWIAIGLFITGAAVVLAFKGLDLVGIRRIPAEPSPACVESYHNGETVVTCQADQRAELVAAGVVICRCTRPAPPPAVSGSAAP